MPTQQPMMVLPQYQGNYFDLQMQQALAQQMMQNASQNQASLIPSNMPVMPKYSIGAGMAQLGQALLAGKMMHNVGEGYQNLGQQQMAYLAGTPTSQQAAADPQQTALAQGAAGGSVGPTNANAQLLGQMMSQGGTQAGSSASGAPTGAAPAAGPAAMQGGLLAPGSALNPSGMDSSKAAYLYYTLGPEKYAEQFVAPYVKPTDATLTARQGGVDPIAANRAALFKNNFVAPITGTGTFRDPHTMQPVAYNAQDIPGTRQLYDAAGNSAGVQPLAGAQAAMQGNAAATAAGEGSQLPYAAVDAAGNPLPVTNRTAAAGGAPAPMRSNNPGALMPGGKLAQFPDMQTGLTALDTNLQSYGKQGVNTLSGVISKWAPPSENDTKAYIADVSQRLGLKPDQKIDLSNPLVRQSLSTAIALHENGPQGVFGGGQGGGAMYAAPPMGAQAAANTAGTSQQNELSKKWTDLNAQNQQAQTTNSYLQNIKVLAQRANLGQMGDKLAYANSLLSLLSPDAKALGVNASDLKASDAVTANNLLDKYQSQIISRLGQGGMGTDAARSIIDSAYPGRKMNEGAINEATDNLVGANQMVQAKTRLLMPFRNKNDAQGYTNAEVQFDQNADPRIFQYANIKDPAARKAFAQTLMQQDPSIVGKIQTLQSLGALK